MSWPVFRRSALLAPVDRHFGDLLHELSRIQGGDAELVAIAGALASAVRREGHVCVSLPERAGRPADAEDAEPAKLPEWQEWESALSTSPLVGGGDEPTPLVLDGKGRLYLLRFHRAERRLLANLRTMLDEPPQELEPQQATRFDELFPPPKGSGDPDGQALAALACARGRFAVITGGPGTGKTTTVARFLALLLHRTPGMRVSLCAPTGKAAARMGEALAGRLADLGVPMAARAHVGEPRTLHRLLGYHPLRDAFRHGPEHPLPADLVVVDEASMVDLSMMDALVAALPPHGRLVLLGDQDQLASVAAGHVLGDLCSAARPELGPGRGLASAWQALGRPALEARPDDASILADAVVRLNVNYRFAEQPGIAALARALSAGRIEEALAALRGDAQDDLELRPHPEGSGTLLEPVTHHLEACRNADDPAAALDALDRFRILCAVRAGPHGVEGLNRVVERWLTDRGSRADRTFYRGRPVLVTANDYGLRLFNGDLGVCWPDGAVDTVWFRGEGGDLRSLSPYRLPQHETAWATTVHKSQGSEAEEVLLILPEQDRQVCTAELIYTAVTRARRRVCIFGDAGVLRLALGRRQRRSSGLGEAFQGRTPSPETRSGN